MEIDETHEGIIGTLNKGEKRKLEVILENDSSTELAPFLGRFTGISPSPKELLYQAYEKAANRNVVGENEAVSIESTIKSTKANEYLIAIYDKHSNTVTFRDAIEVELTPVLKRLRAEQPEESEQIQDYYKAKTALNKEFGSKKARLKIVTRERGEIDASQVRDLDKIAAKVDEKAKEKAIDVEGQEVIKEESSIIPPYDAITTQPSEVYKLDDIVTPAEYDAINIQALLKAKTDKNRLALLPFSSSNYVKSRLIASLTIDKINHKRIKMLMYINYMMAFRLHAFDNVRDRKLMAEKLKNPPNIILDKLYERFVDRTFAKIGGNENFKFTLRNDQKLTCYMLILCLKLDKNCVDPEQLSEDLGIATTKLNVLFKGIGCSVRTLSKKEMTDLGITKEYSAKRAILTAPLKLPEPKKGPRRKK